MLNPQTLHARGPLKAKSRVFSDPGDGKIGLYNAKDNKWIRLRDNNDRLVSSL